MKDVIQSLMEDHGIVLEQAEHFKKTLLDFYKVEDKQSAVFDPFLSFYRNEMKTHFKREEQLVLPAHEKRYPAAPRCRIIFKHEHEMMDKIFERFQRARLNFTEKGANKEKLACVLLEAGLTLVSLIRDHTTFEDHVFFPELVQEESK